MNNLPAKVDAIELALIGGDLSKLSADERINYYKQTCDSLGLNPLTKPFDYIVLNGKLTLYARKDATEQLRKIHGVSITEVEDKVLEGVYIVTAKALDKHGKMDVAKGAVSIANLKGDSLANAMMKAETKAKRRVTLSICGLGMLDETEADSIQGAAVGAVEVETGKITSPVALPTLKTADALQAEQSDVPAHERPINFGKHKGKLWKDLDNKYLQFLVDKANDPYRGMALDEIDRRCAVDEVFEGDDIPDFNESEAA
jgi:hypothetical protein